MTRFGILVDRAADPVADRGRLAHGGGAEAAHQRVVEDSIARGAGQGRHRVHREVAPELVPDVVTDGRRRRHVESGPAQQRVDALQPGR